MINYLKFLFWFNWFDGCKIQVHSKLVNDQVLFSPVLCRSDEHHPVTTVLVSGVKIFDPIFSVNLNIRKQGEPVHSVHDGFFTKCINSK